MAIVEINSRDHIKKIIQIFVISIVVNLSAQLIYYFGQDSMVNVLQVFLYPKYWEVVKLNLIRDRFFIEMQEPALIPILIYLGIKSPSKKYTFFYFLLWILEIFLSTISNFRSLFFMAIVSTYISLFYMVKKIKYSLFLTSLLIMVFIITGYISAFYANRNTIDRIVFATKEETQTLISRIDLWKYSLDLGKAFSLTGVGLGNFYEYLPFKYHHTGTTNPNQIKLNFLSSHNPHNIIFELLSETGFIGLCSYIFLLIYFIRTDKDIFSNKKKEIYPFIISFWTLFLYAAWNPAFTTSFWILFWVLRVLIINYNRNE